jgi:hypothetical protein
VLESQSGNFLVAREDQLRGVIAGASILVVQWRTGFTRIACSFTIGASFGRCDGCGNVLWSFVILLLSRTAYVFPFWFDFALRKDFGFLLWGIDEREGRLSVRDDHTGGGGA